MDIGMTRRDMMRDIGLAAGALVVLGPDAMGQQRGGAQTAQAGPLSEQAFRDGKYVLPPLPYAYNALEPHIGEQTLRIHHDKHHNAYVQGLNAALEQMTAAAKAGQKDLMQHWATLVAFNGSGHVLHTLYWENMTAGGGGQPEGPLAQALQRDFGSYDGFVAAFAGVAAQVRGNGWGVLAWEPIGRRLVVCGVGNHQDNVLVGSHPLLIMDVWEHAYYLNYQNERAKYVETFIKNLIDWDAVNRRFTAVQ